MRLIFVYNADSGRMNTLLDIGHKLLSPKTYKCNLCVLTHGLLEEKKEWKEFKKNTDYELEFQHKDEFETKYKKKYDYPIVLKCLNEDKFEIVLNNFEIDKIKTLKELINSL